jgi:hypothetical protein
VQHHYHNVMGKPAVNIEELAERIAELQGRVPLPSVF